MKDKVRSIVTKGGVPALKILNLGGTTTVTGNLTVYECGSDIIVVDCGIGFPDSDMPGIDVVIPDFSYLLENKEKVRAIFITHAHEDHFGAVPYLLKELNVPVYSGKLVQGFVRARLKDRVSKQLAKKASLRDIEPGGKEIVLGCFKVSAFGMNHSVPDSMGFEITTPQGIIAHISDFKIDWTPVLDEPLEMDKIEALGEKGVLCLLSDCLGVTHSGYSQSEGTLNDTFDNLFEKAFDRQILITTISSNISRMHQIITAAIKANRKVVLAGRSIRQSVEIAQSLGYLNFDKNIFLAEKESSDYLQKDIVYLIAGCYGQQNSALARVSRDEHRFISIEEGAMVVFSADPNPPGTREDVERVQDSLILDGSEVIYSEIQDNLHVSGHGTRGDIMTIAAVVNPKFFIPIGGTITKMRAYAHMAEELGFKKKSVFENLDGDSVIFQDENAKKGERIEVKQVLAEGYGASEVQPIVVKDRGVLSSDGVLVVLVPRSKDSKKVIGKVDLITRGFVYVKEAGELVGQIKTRVNKLLKKHEDKISDWGFVKSRIEKEIEKLLYKKTGRRPMVIVHSVQI